MTDLRKKCNEIISILQDSFNQGDRSAPDFSIKNPINTRKKAVGEGGANYHMYNKNKIQHINFDSEITFDNSLEDPSVSIELNEINKDETKKKKFQDFLEQYFSKN